MEFNSWNPGFSTKKKLEIDPEYSPKNVHVLQVDVGVFPENSVSFGCIFKNPTGEILFSARKKESMNVDPLLAEMLAIRWSLLLAKEFRVERLVMQSDCLNAVDCINNVVYFTATEHVALDCRFLMTNFCNACVMFLPRSCNIEVCKIVRVGFALGYTTQIGGSPLWNSDVELKLA